MKDFNFLAVLIIIIQINLVHSQDIKLLVNGKVQMNEEVYIPKNQKLTLSFSSNEMEKFQIVSLSVEVVPMSFQELRKYEDYYASSDYLTHFKSDISSNPMVDIKLIRLIRKIPRRYRDDLSRIVITVDKIYDFTNITFIQEKSDNITSKEFSFYLSAFK